MNGSSRTGSAEEKHAADGKQDPQIRNGIGETLHEL